MSINIYCLLTIVIKLYCIIVPIERGCVFMNFRYKLMQFMSGRYGSDELSYGLIILSVIIAAANIFVRFISYKDFAVLQMVVYALLI